MPKSKQQKVNKKKFVTKGPAKISKAKRNNNDPKHEDENKFYPAEEQGILKKKTTEEKETEMEDSQLDEDIYTEEGREKQQEDDEIEAWEEGLMEGASEAAQLGKDALTGEPLMDIEDVVEAVIEGKRYRFASEKNAKKFRRKKELEED